MNDTTLIDLAAIGVIGIACQWFAWWIRLPAILFLLLAGILAGPVSGWLQPEALFGDLLFPMVSLAVAVILFEGSLTLRLEEIRGIGSVVRRLVGIGVLVTWSLIALAAHLFVGFDWPMAILFGAITVVTGPTVIVPMLRSIRPNERLTNILRWEGIIIDPVGALLAILVFEFIIAQGIGTAFEHTLKTFASIVAIGVALGILFAQFLGIALRRYWIPDYLRSVVTLALVFGVFVLSNWLQEESGLLAVTLMGLWLANMKGVPVEDILDFKESLSLLLISVLFIVLAARIDFAQMRALGWSALGVLLVVQLLARPLKVIVATLGSSLSWRERALLGWIAPRGIVAAAIAALFAIRLSEAGFEQAPLLVPLTFLIIIGTVVIQSATARPLARLLGVAEPEARGVLIIGANPVARVIAGALRDLDYRVLLTDPDWTNIRAAMMQGFPTYYGNPVSEHAERHLDLIGLGKLFGLSPSNEMNLLSAIHYQREFGRANIYLLRAGDEEIDSTHGKQLFGVEVSYSRLKEMLEKGAKIHSTPLTETFGIDDYYREYFKRAVPLFALTPRGRLRIFTTESELSPEQGWTLVALVEPRKADGEPSTEHEDTAARTTAMTDG